MQKSYTIAGGEHRLCVRVEMPHSHADGWAPEEIGRFADQLFGVGEDVSPLPVVVESGCEEDGSALTCTVECSGAPLEEVQLCYSRADGCKHSRRMRVPLVADDTHAFGCRLGGPQVQPAPGRALSLVAVGRQPPDHAAGSGAERLRGLPDADGCGGHALLDTTCGHARDGQVGAAALKNSAPVAKFSLPPSATLCGSW